MFVFFFFSSRRRHTRSLRDWSSDVCSSDLRRGGVAFYAQQGEMNIAVDIVGYTVPITSGATVSGAAPLFVGSGPPAASVGVDGAVYLDTSTGLLFGPKAAGVWPTTPLSSHPAATAQGADDLAATLDAGANLA